MPLSNCTDETRTLRIQCDSGRDSAYVLSACRQAGMKVCEPLRTRETASPGVVEPHDRDLGR